MGIKRCGPHTNGQDRVKYFKKQNLGRHSFSKIAKIVYSRLDLRGDGAYNVVATHGLRATMVTILIEAVYDDVTITQGTGH